MKKYLLAWSLCVATTLNGQEVKIHTIGDSTMADYAENTTRTRGWGEVLQEFFQDEAQVHNYARGGRSSRSFFEEGRWQTVKNNLSPGDYLFIQFAHNDAKEGGKDGADFRGTAPWTTYKRFLELYVDETRALQGNPILITPIVRRYFDKEGKITPKGCHDLGIAPDDSTLNY
ncbi:MAG: SGNH/GDSL hydrolase family protein, partial [Phocaeicola sp.]